MYENASIANQTQSSPAALANGVASAYEVAESETQTIERLPVQLKLSVGAPNDPLEYEADAMADRVMRMPENTFIQRKSLRQNNAYDDEHVQLKPYQTSFLQRCACNNRDDEHVQLKPMGYVSSFIQRKSSCSCGDYDDDHVHLKPLVNQITPFIQAKGDSGTTVNDSVSSQIRSTMGSGNSMQGGTKSFMENRFGADFSDVKIHTGSQSAQLSQALNAKAFTVSNNIYFNSGQYQPDTSSGKHLLAHELTHVVQQGGTAGQDVQRKVSPKMGEIRDRLTYGIFDWAITDSDVHDVLVDLQALIPLDLRDTVAVMEKEGLVTRLYDNLAESAERTKPFVPILMQQVQDARFLKGGGNGSCNAKQTAQSGSALGKIKEWANTTIDAVSDFEIGIDPVKSARIGKLLDKYFFHEAQARALSAAQRINFARLIISRIKTMRDKAAGTIINCASPFDLMCSGGNAIAYVSRGNPSVLRVCSIFFNDGAGSQIATTFHELMHFYNPQVDDTGYRHERIFEYLPPDRAVNNADSYSTFAMEIVLGEKAAAKELRSARDNVQGCNPQQETNLRREIAFATRMIQNAVNQIDDNYPVQNSGNFASTNFHSTNHQDLIKFVERFHTVQNSTLYRIFFHCNITSAQTTDALPFIDNDGLTLTQPYFNIASENNRVANLLAILFRKYSSGMTAAIWPSAPAYAIQTLNQAYTNPAAYASYAQGVSFNSTAWNFADADVRYREEIQRTLERVRTEFNESFDDSEFKTHITDNINTYFANQLQAVHFTNHAQLDTGTTTLLQKITIIRALTDRMYHDYMRVNNDNFFTGLMTFDGSIFSESRLYRVFDFSYNRALTDLSDSFGPILVRIDNGEAIKFADWTDYPALLTKYQTESRNAISVMSTYKNYLKKLNTAKESYNKSSESLRNSPKVAGLPLIDSIFAHIELLSTNTAFVNEISKIENNIAIEVIHGRRFNPRNPDLPVSENLLRQFESRLSKIVHPSKLRVHKKLSVGAVNDPLEYEADAMADKVMKTPDDQTIQRKASCSCNDYDDEHVHLKPLANQVTPFIQAKGDEGSTVSNSVSDRVKSTMGGGSPLSDSTKSFMENRFGTDFSDVKIHTGDESIQLSQELNAKAFTVSNNVYFNSGQYQPDTSSGKHLLAHELTHVVQQGKEVSRINRDIYDDEEIGGTSFIGDVGLVSKITIIKRSGKAIFKAGEKEHLGYAEKLDLQPGTYDITADIKSKKWIIKGRGVRSGLRFNVTMMDVIDVWQLAYSDNLKLEVEEDEDNLLNPNAEEYDYAQKHNKIVGLEELYKKVKLYDTLSPMVYARVGKGGTIIAVKDDRGFNERKKNLLAEINISLKASNFKSIEEFNESIDSYRKSFEAAAVNQAYEILKRSESIAHKEFDRYYLNEKKDVDVIYNQASVIKKLESQIERHQQKIGELTPSGGTENADEIQAENEKKQNVQQKADEIYDRLIKNYPILKDEQFKREYLGRYSYEDLKAALAANAQDKLINIYKTKNKIKESPEIIYKFDNLIEHTKRVKDIQQGSIDDLIINDTIKQISDRDFLFNIGIGILAIALGLVSFGTGTVAVLAAVGAAGLSTYIAIKDIGEYLDDHAASNTSFDKETALLSKDPSLFWVIVSVAGAAVDIGAAASAFAKVAKISKAFTESTDAAKGIITYRKSIGELSGVNNKIKTSLIKYAENQVKIEKGFQNLAKTATTLNSLANPEMITHLIELSYYFAKKGVLKFDVFLNELKAKQIIKSLTLDEKDITILKDAFDKGISKYKELPHIDIEIENAVEKAFAEHGIPDTSGLFQTTQRLIRGNVGERLAADALSKDGHLIISYKPSILGTNQGGIDIVTFKDGKLFLIDNKALSRTGNVSSVSALTTNFTKNLETVKSELRTALNVPGISEGERKVLQDALKAAESNNYVKVVTNANILTPDGKVVSGVTETLKNKNIEFIDVFP
jgi:hypothetical protein